MNASEPRIRTARIDLHRYFCPYCGEDFPDGASCRLHMGDCPEHPDIGRSVRPKDRREDWIGRIVGIHNREPLEYDVDLVTVYSHPLGITGFDRDYRFVRADETEFISDSDVREWLDRLAEELSRAMYRNVFYGKEMEE